MQAYSSWPTYPQVYAGGELVGGCDLILELQGTGDLKGVIDEALAGPPRQEPASLQERLRQLTTAKPVMLFMKVGCSSRLMAPAGPAQQESARSAFRQRSASVCLHMAALLPVAWPHKPVHNCGACAGSSLAEMRGRLACDPAWPKFGPLSCVG